MTGRLTLLNKYDFPKKNSTFKSTPQQSLQIKLCILPIFSKRKKNKKNTCHL